MIRNHELLTSKTISIEFEEGCARVGYIYEPPYKYLDNYKGAEKEIKLKKENIWSIPYYISGNEFAICLDSLKIDYEEPEI